MHSSDSDHSTWERANVPRGERVLVTGGAGFIGSHLVDALLERGHDVRVYDNLEPQAHGGLRERGEWPAYLSPEAERVRGDIRDRQSLRRALRGVDIVFHLAALVGVGLPSDEVADVNVRGTALLLDLLAEEHQRVGRLIVASSAAIYGEGTYHCPACGIVHPPPREEAQLRAREWEIRCPQCGRTPTPQPIPEDQLARPASVYASTKRSQEELCLAQGRALGIAVTALRYFNVYGPRQSPHNPYTGAINLFGRRLLQGKPPILFEDGQQTRDFIHVADVVQANLRALAQPQDGVLSLNIGSGRPATVRQVTEALNLSLGRKIAPEVPGTYRPGDLRHSCADISRARESLGFAPRVPFDQGIDELAGWLAQQGACRAPE
jgi:dTDP-L-rhamnose 4-epimerase